MANFKKIFEKLSNEKLYSITPIDKGLSNENYLVNDRYVLRIKNNIGKNFYNPKTEFQAMKDIKKLQMLMEIKSYQQVQKISINWKNVHHLSH